MDDVKLPDLAKLDATKKRIKKLPPQESANDTSNWEERSISVPVVDIEKKKTVIRQFDLMRAGEAKLDMVTLAQVQEFKKNHSENPSK